LAYNVLCVAIVLHMLEHTTTERPNEIEQEGATFVLVSLPAYYPPFTLTIHWNNMFQRWEEGDGVGEGTTTVKSRPSRALVCACNWTSYI
jgi:hypothetical protein